MADDSRATRPVKFCVIHACEDRVEALTEVLREAWPSCHAERIKSQKGLDAAIAGVGCDLVIGTTDGNRFDAVKAQEGLRERGLTIPVVGLREPDSEATVVSAMRSGLADLVDVDDSDHLLLVLERELRRRRREKRLAQRDFTGVNSRMYFLELLSGMLAGEQSDRPTQALAYLQLDSFGWINERFGIVSGDHFLKSVAEIILTALSEGDIPARYHGGTFVMLLSGEGVNAIEERAGALAAAIANYVHELGEHAISSTASIGLALVSDTVVSSQSLVSNASQACEDARASGGDAVRWYGAQSTAAGKAADHEAWITRIRHAFENDMFTLLFQPIISLQGDQTPRYEVLLRMLNDDGDTIAPGAFLPFAERAGLMADIDRWVITHTIFAAQRQRESKVECQMFLKLSGTALTDRNMPAWIDRVVQDAACPAAMLVFEITESLALTNLGQTRALIGKLRQVGCGIGLDHFGTSPNSLKFLDQLDVDYVKIDGSLIRGLAKAEQSQKQVRRIIELARTRGIGTIAESIQDASSLPLIWQYGVGFIQGYFLQEPASEMRYDFTEVAI